MLRFVVQLLAIGLAGVLHAQTLTDIGSAAPTPGSDDLSQLSISGNKTAPDGLNYYTDNQVALSTGEPGQTFTTGANSVGYVLQSLAIRTAGLNSYSGISTSQPYYLHLYSISGSTATLLQTYTSNNIAFSDGDWLRWTGLSQTLAANTVYAWSFGKVSAGGFEAMSVASGNPFTGGEIALISPTTGTVTLGSTHGFDATFDVGLVLNTVPRIPSATVLPKNNVIAGTEVTLSATVTGAAPLSYQWQFNAGGGFADLAGANTNPFTFTVETANTGSYRLVVTNTYDTVTSAPISLVVTPDTSPPVVLGAFNIGETTLQVDFSKRLDVSSATNVANYSFSNGTAITGASLAPDGKTVLLTTAPLSAGASYTLVINGVRDQAVPPNTIASTTTVSISASPRQRILLDAGWRFQLGDPADVTTNVTYYPEISNLWHFQAADVSGNTSETYYESVRPDIFATHAGEDVSFVKTNYDDSAWRSLDLPHDWAVELPFDSSAQANHGFKPIGEDSRFAANNIGWYRRTFTLPAASAGKSMGLDFGGVYRNSLVWLNGHLVGRNVSGYSPFYFDVTPYLNPGGTNVLVVRVDASRYEGWWYEGAGIYRHIWLTMGNPVHVAQWGTFVKTTTLSGSNATVSIQTEVTNQGGSATSGATLASTIYDAAGNAVTSVTSPINIPAGQGVVTTQSVSFAANLWSLENPYLYKLVTTVSNQSATADIYNTPFGVRTVTISTTNGVFLNGKRVPLQGMCNHQDHAGVGTALPDRLQYYRLERLKQMGVNAYRTSHNIPTEELLDACDQVGMLVLDENRRIGTEAEPLSQLERQIRRDRNHPSIFMWCLANEEPLESSSTGASIIQTMQNLVHSLDPTRLCTAANREGMNGWLSGFTTVIDVMGFNYSPGGMDAFHAALPNKPCIGTEISSAVGDRGVYATGNSYVDSYDDSTSGQTAQTWVSHYNARPWASGAFSWTGFDYRGEPYPTGWPTINSHFGTLDTCGFPKDNFYYYLANWSLKPVLHLLPHWNWQAGNSVKIWAYSNCQSVELFVNGVSQGRKTNNVQSHVEWTVPSFSAGSIQAVGYNSGAPVLTKTIVTAGAPASIVLSADRSTILSDGRDVSMVTVSVVDAQGNPVPTASNKISFANDGGKIIGVGNGDPNSLEPDKASQRSLFNGLAQVILQSTAQPGSITLTATASGLNPATLTLTTAQTLPPPTVPTGVAAVGGNGQVTVSWDIVPWAISYGVWRSSLPGGPYTLVTGNQSGTYLGYIDHPPTDSSVYYYVLTANGTGTGASAYSAEVRAEVVTAPGPKALYAFEGNALDTSGNGNHGTATSVSYVAGKEGSQAAQFNGTSSYVSIPRSVTDDFTVTMWVKTTDTAGSAGAQWWSGKGLVDGEVGGAGADWGTAIVNGKFVIGIGSTGGDSTFASSVNINDGAWHYLAATRNNTSGAVEVYVDGVLRGSGTGATGSRTFPANLRIGSLQTGNNFLNGTLDDVRLYDQVLTATEIAASSGPPPFPTGLAGTAISTSQIDLVWTASATATGYRIKRATTSGGPYTSIATPVTTSYSDTSASVGLLYYYVVSATNAAGESVESAEISARSDSLILHLKLDETGGTVANDSSGYANQANLLNGPVFGPGRLDNALAFSKASSQYATLPVGLVSTLNDFTISAWVKPTTLDSWARIFDFGTGTGVYMFLAPQNGANGKVRFAITTAGYAGEQYIDGQSTLATGTWSHVAISWSGNTGILYINGVEVGRNSAMTLKPSSLGNTTQNYLGKSQYPDTYFNGALDDFRIYSRALTSGEVQTLAAGQLAAPQNLVASPGNGQIPLTWNAVSGATGYIVRRSSISGGPYADLASVVAATSYADTSLADGTTWYYTIAATGLPGTGTPSNSVSATTFTAVENWRFANFGTTANTGNAADAADPDGDGRSNLLEYSTGTNPLLHDSGQVASMGQSGDGLRLTLTFSRIADPALTYIVEAKNDLTSATWTTIWSSTGASNVAGSVTVIDTELIADHPRRFLRLRVER